MVIFGLIGYAFKKLGYPLAPMVWRWSWAIAPKKTSATPIKGSQGDLGCSSRTDWWEA